MDKDTIMNEAQKKPAVTVMICTYNRAELLPRAIQSVLDQNFSDWELLILDDASTDNTKEVVQVYLHDQRIRYIRHDKNIGLGQNRKAGVAESNGTYIAILDSDDEWTDKSKLRSEVECLEKDPHLGVIGTFGTVVDEKGTTLRQLKYHVDDQDIRNHILAYDQFLHSSVVFRKEAIEKTAGYDASLAPAEDYDLILRIGLSYTFANVPKSMVKYLVHAGNSSSNERRKKVRHAKLHLLIIKKNRNTYPNYYYALMKAYARILAKIIGL